MLIDLENDGDDPGRIKLTVLFEMKDESVDKNKIKNNRKELRNGRRG